MASVSVSKEIPIDADVLWREIGTFGSIGQWHPMLQRVEVQGGESPGARRTAHAADGSVQVERLTQISPADRCYRYVMESTAMPIRDYRGELHVIANRDGTSTVEWSSEFGVTTDNETEPVEGVRKFLAAGLEQLQARYGYDES